MMDHILVVDDEPGIRTILGGVLESAGYKVDAVASGEEALAALDGSEYDLLLVDLQLTGMDGLGVIDAAKRQQPQLATVILTGFATVDSAIAALHRGVDDYLVKPARPEAIRNAVSRALARRRAAEAQNARLARIASELQTLLREPSAAATTSTEPPHITLLKRGPLEVDESGYRARWQGELLELTLTEFKLLAYMARHEGDVLSPQQLVAAVQGYHCSLQEARELIKPHLYRLREVLEHDASQPRYLQNVRGVGYVLRLEAGSRPE